MASRREDQPRPHGRRCADNIRERALATAGLDVPSPGLVTAIAAQIHDCCGHHLLKSFRLAAGWTVQQAIEELKDACSDLPVRGLSERSWRNWEAAGRPDVDYQDRLSRLFHANPVILGFAADYSGNHRRCTPTNPDATDTTRGDPTKRRDLLKLAAITTAPFLISGEQDALAEAHEYTRSSEATDLGPATLERIQADIAAYGEGYADHPASRLLHDVGADRRAVAQLLLRRQTLTQRRELYVCAGWLSLILGWLHHDVGYQRTATAYALDAFTHGDQAGNDEICAWAKDLQATIALYDDKPAQALTAAQHGAARAPRGTTAKIRLVTQVLRLHARTGAPDAFDTALPVVLDEADRLPDCAGGLFGADTARLHSFAASASLWLNRPEQAARYAQRASTTYRATPALAPTRRAIAELDLAIALTHLGHPDRGVEHGTTALAATRPAAAILNRARDLNTALTGRYPASADTRDFNESLRIHALAISESV